jgi:trehalose 2-sulfotransferase
VISPVVEAYGAKAIALAENYFFLEHQACSSLLIREVTMQPLCSYLICATPQSGSTLLCEALKKTGRASWPEEYFAVLKNTSRREPLAAYFQSNYESARWSVLSPADYIERVLEVGTSCNGMFGARIMWNYFDDFMCSLRCLTGCRDIAVRDLLASVFPNLHYIWVTRRNKVRQAVSLWKASHRQTWKQDEPSLPKSELTLHFEVIDRLAQQIVADEADWWRYFDACGFQPFTVVYEDMIGAAELTAHDVLRYLKIPIPDAHQLKQEHRAGVLANSHPLRDVVGETPWA